MHRVKFVFEFHERGISQIARVRRPNVGPITSVMLDQRWHSTLGQCNVAHWGMVEPTVGFTLGQRRIISLLHRFNVGPTLVTPTFEIISDIVPM